MTSTNIMIKLNVGGKFIDTDLNNLTKHSDSRLAKMFLINLEGIRLSACSYYLDTSYDSSTSYEQTGRYFIDRDPDTFKYILKYLRDDKINFDGMEKRIVQDILDDAEKLHLLELVKLCQVQLTRM